MIRFIALPKLRELREALGSQDEMVRLINAHTGSYYGRTFYTNIENGTRGVAIDVALAISRILNTEVDTIFSSKTEEERSEE